MSKLFFLIAIVLIVAVVWEIFETIVLPRKIYRYFRLTRYYYVISWTVYRSVFGRIRDLKRRSAIFGIFGPLSLLGLFALWAVVLAFAFALLYSSLGTMWKVPDGDRPSFAIDLYASGTAITTLGLGDVTSRSHAARLLMVVEAGLGLGLVALAVSYLPALYQAFSRREIEIALLDARAGSPPSATELLHRAMEAGSVDSVGQLITGWERWCAEILESHISYPVLCLFRSQHVNQSWVSALSLMLDTCSLYLSCWEKPPYRAQAQWTFAMARHVAVDISQVLRQQPATEQWNRLSRELFHDIWETFREYCDDMRDEEESWRLLNERRTLYEPYLLALGVYLRMGLASWRDAPNATDNWLRS